MGFDAEHAGTAARPAGGIHRLVAERVRLTPDARALREAVGGAELTYRQLWRRAGHLAARLTALGVGPGDLVALELNRSNDLLVALLAVTRAGAAYLPLDSHAPAERIAAVLEDADVRAVLTGTGPSLRERPLHAPASATVLPVPTGRGAESDWAEDPHTDEEGPCYVGYTSGSTGTPKGVVVPHRAILDLVTEPAHGEITAADRVGQLANPAFDAFTWEVWGALTAGATLVVLPSVVELDLERWTALLATEGITTALLTTSLFHMVAREAPGSLAPLRQLLVGGEAMDLAATLAVLAAGGPGRLTNIYGPTETTVLATFFDCTDESLAGRTRIPIGRPVRAAELYVVGPDLTPVAPGETGELLVAGPSVTSGYLRRPERTAESFLPYGDGLRYRTGDLVRQLPDGLYEILGRVDRQVKLRGFRIELEEVEHAATATGRTTAAFVEKTGEGHTALLVGAFLADPAHPGGAEAQGRELAEALARTLPSYMLPARWLPLAELPYGSTGKADRARIRALLAQAGEETGEQDGQAGQAAADALRPADPLEARIAEVWAELLGVRDISSADDFIGLGGNSILATQTAFRLTERLGTELTPTDVLLATDLADLADRLRG
ncbi:non-ribosomal peptide synthetase [Streptomyces sp. NBC_00249]|uniref:non-ribosomal peptide synthetase n=1 Tax=Streptomyces sp. NBC_00249 TaxID=2975690 RepID=UPI002257ABEA|nr:non-ribosomal peptide synthetase [Streptomyces sp. NBC_00249]MCX5195233.1 non-ribosomal peptide synthetase [Streptomyces sp. NBC_00249]